MIRDLLYAGIFVAAIVALISFLAIMTAVQAWRAHVNRYGFLPVVMRWLSGRQRHGLEGDDRRYDDRYDPTSRHYHARERWSRAANRFSLVFGLPLAAILGAAFYVTHFPPLGIYTFFLVGLIAVSVAARMTVLGRLAWTGHGHHLWLKPHRVKDVRVAYVRRPRTAGIKPLHKKLSGIIGTPHGAKPGQWIRLTPSGRGVEIKLPKHWNGSEADRTRIAQAARETLGLHPDSQPDWRLGSGESSVVIQDHEPTPDRVELKEIRKAIDQAGANKAVLGIGRGREPVSVSLEADSPHFGLSIAAGGGKSQIARLLAAQVLHNGGIVLFLDIKRISHAWARDLPNVRYARTIDEIHEALLWLAEEIDRRTLVADAAADVEGEVLANVGPRALVVAEELNEMLTRLRSYWSAIRTKDQPKKSPAITSLETALFMGRQIRVNMLAVAQMMTALASGSGAARENMGVRILGRYSRNNWKMLVPEFDMPVRSMRPGRVQVVSSSVRECQVAFVTGAEARAFSQNGVVTPWPAPVEPGIGTPAIPASTSESKAPESKEVTLAEAVERGLTTRNVKALKNAINRDPSFPKPVGRRMDQHGRPNVYDPAAIERWDKQ